MVLSGTAFCLAYWMRCRSGVPADINHWLYPCNKCRGAEHVQTRQAATTSADHFGHSSSIPTPLMQRGIERNQTCRRRSWKKIADDEVCWGDAHDGTRWEATCDGAHWWAESTWPRRGQHHGLLKWIDRWTPWRSGHITWRNDAGSQGLTQSSTLGFADVLRIDAHAVPG